MAPEIFQAPDFFLAPDCCTRNISSARISGARNICCARNVSCVRTISCASHISGASGINFWTMLAPFGSQVGDMLATFSAKMGQPVEFPPLFCWLVVFFRFHRRFDPILVPFWLHFGASGIHFELFWVVFWTILGTIWGIFAICNWMAPPQGTRPPPPTILVGSSSGFLLVLAFFLLHRFFDAFWDRLFVDFSPQLGSKSPPKSVKTIFDSIYGSIVGRFLIDLLLIFGTKVEPTGQQNRIPNR